MSTKNVMLATITGLVSGIALGMLFAPDKGERTRKKLMRKKDDYLEEISERFNEFKEDVEEFQERVNNAKSFIKKGKDKAGKIVDDFTS